MINHRSTMMLKSLYFTATCMAVCIAASLPEGIFFLETFDQEQDVFGTKWTKSLDVQYKDQPVMIKSADYPPKGAYMCMTGFREVAKICTALTPPPPLLQASSGTKA